VTRIRNFGDVEKVLSGLYGVTRTGGVYTLDVPRQLMEVLGNPQNSFKTIHVAGTSGKTSTSYYSAALLQQAGHTTGLTVSPHVQQVNERIQFDLVPLPEAEYCAIFEEFWQIVKASGLRPTYFEFLVALAFWEFARRGIDYAVVEVGLGGLLDTTNVITRADKICVITDIGLDHTQVLGNTIAEIAAQKAGIIQPGNQVCMYKQEPDVMDAVDQAVAATGANLTLVETRNLSALSSLPLFQQRNLGLAVAAVNAALKRDDKEPLTNEQIQQAAHTQVPARMQTFTVDGKTVIVDGAHNAQKIGRLTDSLRAKYPNMRVAALVAFVDGPDSRWQGGLDALLPSVESIIVTTFGPAQDLPRPSVDPASVVAYVQQHGHAAARAIIEPPEAFKALLEQDADLYLVAGSFFLPTNIMPLLKGHPA
jgi:dihydrofolate synthase/folylpolyglutamate synthase